jgi:hypothetical protein
MWGAREATLTLAACLAQRRRAQVTPLGLSQGARQERNDQTKPNYAAFPPCFLFRLPFPSGKGLGVRLDSADLSWRGSATLSLQARVGGPKDFECEKNQTKPNAFGRCSAFISEAFFARCVGLHRQPRTVASPHRPRHGALPQPTNSGRGAEQPNPAFATAAFRGRNYQTKPNHAGNSNVSFFRLPSRAVRD